MNVKYVIGIDLGSYSVKVLQLNKDNQYNKFYVVAYDEILLDDMFLSINKKFLEIESQGLSLEEKQVIALELLIDLERFSSETFVSGLNNITAQLCNISIPLIENRKLKLIFNGIIESQIPFNINKVKAVYTLKYKKNKNFKGKILIAFAKKRIIDKQLKLFAKVNIDPSSITLNSISLYNLYDEILFRKKFLQIKSELLILIDIGHFYTNVIMFNAYGPVMGRTIMQGGYGLISVISKIKNISYKDSQKIKNILGVIKKKSIKTKQDLKEKELSNLLKKALNSLIKEIKQTLLSVFIVDGTDISSIIINGGTSQIKGLRCYFKEKLSMKVVSLYQMRRVGNFIDEKIEFDESPRMATAFSYSIIAFNSVKKYKKYEFRQGEFIWKGNFKHFKLKKRIVYIWLLIIFFTIILYGFVKNFSLNMELSQVKLFIKKRCNNIAAQRLSINNCFEYIKRKIEYNNKYAFLNFSAFDVYSEIFQNIINDVKVKIVDLDITGNLIKIKGITDKYENIDIIRNKFLRHSWFESVKKGKARQIVKENIEFLLIVKLIKNIPYLDKKDM